MAKLNELIYNIKNLLAGGRASDDMLVSNEQIAFWINYYRVKVIKQDREKNPQLKQIYIQNLGKVEMIQTDRNECCDTTQCVLRTKVKIPTLLETNGTRNITFVGTVLGKPFQETFATNVPYVTYDKYTGKDPKWFYENGYIYLVNPISSILKYINIRGVFEDPLLAEDFVTCGCANVGTEGCRLDYDFEYPLPQFQIDIVVKMIAQTELALISGTYNDTTNDGQDVRTESKSSGSSASDGIKALRKALKG